MKKIVCLAFIFCIAITTRQSAASVYESIYQIPYEVPYCSSNPDNGMLGAYPCDSDSYLHKEVYTGFKNLWNPNDPKRRCQFDALPCPYDGSGLVRFSLGSIGNSQSVTGELFRYYIPKGTNYVSLILYGPATEGKCATIARFGKPPVSDIPINYDPFIKPQNYPAYFPPVQYPNGNDDFRGGKTIEQLEHA